MKNILLTVLVFLTIATLTFALVSCDVENTSGSKKDEENSHVHTPAEAVRENEVVATCEAEGSYDEVIYCRECKAEMSRIARKSQIANHKYENNKCNVCGNEFLTSEGLEFTLSDDETYYSVTGIGTCTDTDLVIPSKYKSLPVKSIGDLAFRLNFNITSVAIPDSVTNIGEIAFWYCSSLASIVIPDSVTGIGNRAFSNCSSLSSIEVDKNNIAYKSIDGNLYTKDEKTLVQYAIGKPDTSFAIPECVEIIGDSAFTGCRLTSIEIPDSITSIGDAFSGCSILKITNNSNLTLTFGSSEYGSIAKNAKVIVDKDGNKTYNNTLTLEYIETEDNFLFEFKDGAYTLIAYVGAETTVTLPADINGNEYKINNMRGVVNVVVPKGIISIGNRAFSNCSSLTSIVIPDSVMSIGEKAFSFCSSLTSIVIGDSVTNIGSSAFMSCDSLTSIVIPDSVTSIENYAFSSCSSLTSIVIPDSVTSIAGSAFCACNSLASIEVAKNNIAYKSIDGNLYTKDGKTLVRYAMGKTDTSFTVPECVESIGDWAFSSQTFFAIIQMGDMAFSSGTTLSTVVIGDSVTNIGSSAFDSCDSLTSIVIGDSVTNIGSSAFDSCDSLTSIVIGDSVISIGSSAFDSCDSLTSIVIGDSVTSIGNYAFSYCDSLANVYYKGTAEEWDAINISFQGDFSLDNATRYYYSESEPSEDGSYWHYNDDGEIEVWY